MEFIFKMYYLLGNEIFFFAFVGCMFAIIIACFTLGYLESEKWRK